MQNQYSTEDIDLFQNPSNSVEHEINKMPPPGYIACITDPPGANIYINGVLQPQQTPTTITVTASRYYDVTFTMSGYVSYTQTIRVNPNETVTVYAALQSTAKGNILAITDPSGANIYLDGTLQLQQTSATITNVDSGNHTITFTKTGYTSYTETINIIGNQTVKVCAILQKIVIITDYGIVICTTPNISSCPITPISCPISVNPLNYVNFIAILNSAISINLTINFLYMVDSIAYTENVPVTLLTGTNIVYAFPTNAQYSPNAVISLTEVTLS